MALQGNREKPVTVALRVIREYREKLDWLDILVLQDNKEKPVILVSQGKPVILVIQDNKEKQVILVLRVRREKPVWMEVRAYKVKLAHKV